MKTMTDLYWETIKGNYAPGEKAMATSITPHNGQLIIRFEGKTSGGEAYTGGMRLPLSTTRSLVNGICTTRGKDEPFQLIGSFQDPEFTRYEGTWSEGSDYVAIFSFDRTA